MSPDHIPEEPSGRALQEDPIPWINCAKAMRSTTLQFLEKHGQLQNATEALSHQANFFMLVRALRCFDSTTYLAMGGFSYEALPLLRSQLETLIDLVFINRAKDPEDAVLNWIAHGEVDRARCFEETPAIGVGWTEKIKTIDELTHRAKLWKKVGVRQRALACNLDSFYDSLHGFLSGWSHAASYAVDTLGVVHENGQTHFRFGATLEYSASCIRFGVVIHRAVLGAFCWIWHLTVDEARTWTNRCDTLFAAADGSTPICESTEPSQPPAMGQPISTVPEDVPSASQSSVTTDDHVDVMRWEKASHELDQVTRDFIVRHQTCWSKPSSPLMKASFYFFARIFRNYRAVRNLAEDGFGPEALMSVRPSLETLIDFAFIATTKQPEERLLEWSCFGETQRIATRYALHHIPPDVAQAIAKSEAVAKRAKAWASLSIERRAQECRVDGLYKEYYRSLSAWVHGRSWIASGYAKAMNQGTGWLIGPKKLWPDPGLFTHTYNLNAQFLRGTVSLLSVIWRLPHEVVREWDMTFIKLTTGLIDPATIPSDLKSS